MEPSNSPRFTSLAFAALAILLSLASFGVFMNDEAGQLEGFKAMRQGQFTGPVTEETDHFFAAGENFIIPDNTGPSSGVFIVSLLSLPFYFLFKILDPILPPARLLLLLWGTATYIMLRRGISSRYRHKTGREFAWYSKPVDGAKWHQRLIQRLTSFTPAHYALTIVLGIFFLVQWIQQTPPPYELWGEMFALQTMNILTSALAMALWFRLVEAETRSRRVATIAATAYLISPITFWALGIKYHGLSISMMVAALYLYRSEKLRLWSWPVAVASLLTTPLMLPLPVGMAIAEAYQLSRSDRFPDRQAQLRYAGIASSLFIGGIGTFLLFNRLFLGDWLASFGVAGGVFENLAKLPELFRNRARFESWETSFNNVWKLWLWPQDMEDGPLAFPALAPLMVMAFFVWPAIRKNPSRIAIACLTHTVLFFVAFIHGAHVQGAAILDFRYFLTAIPPLLILAAIAIRDRVEAMDKDDLMFIPKGFGLGLAFVVPILLFLGTNDIALYPERETHQLVRASWAVGFAGMGAMLATTIWRSKIGARKADQFWAVATGYAFISPFIWLFMMTILVIRQIPTWPFGSDAASFDYLLPSLEGLRWWWGPKLLP